MFSFLRQGSKIETDTRVILDYVHITCVWDLWGI